MLWLKRDPFLRWLLCVAVAVLAAEAYWLGHTRAEAIRAGSILAQKNREREGFETRSPVPTEENERAVSQAVTQAQTALSAAAASLCGSATESTIGPIGKPIDAYFTIASFVEKNRALAAESAISIRPDEQFGFASHAREGPPVDRLAVVLRQRAIAESLIGILFAARPTGLISLQRERSSATIAPAPQENPADFFALAPGLTLRKTGVLETDAFKLEFTGPTRVLRDFLNGLGESHGGFAVRYVESEPAGEAVAHSGVNAKSGNVVPVIADGLSRFRVVVERLRPVIDATGATP